MSAKDNIKIAKWLGWKSDRGMLFHYLDKDGNSVGLPNFKTNNSDAITLLPILVERGYWVTLETVIRTINHKAEVMWNCKIETDFGEMQLDSYASAISNSITSAVLELIEKEGKG